MDNNFSAQVKEIISFSREEALRLGNDFIGTEHLLLGLIREGDNTAVRILKSFNVDLYELRKEVEMAVKDKTGKNIANNFSGGYGPRRIQLLHQILHRSADTRSDWLRLRVFLVANAPNADARVIAITTDLRFPATQIFLVAAK